MLPHTCGVLVELEEHKSVQARDVVCVLGVLLKLLIVDVWKEAV
jgi:hypothetical protein